MAKQTGLVGFPFAGWVAQNSTHQGAAGDTWLLEIGPVNASASVTGVNATSGVGGVSVTFTGNISIVGVSASTGVGALTAASDSNITLTGVASTTAIGIVTVTGDSNINLTGVAGSTGLGTVAVIDDSNINLTGVSATADQTAPSVSIIGPPVSVTLTGIQTTAAIGTLSVTPEVMISGQSATAALGALTTYASFFSGVASVPAIGSPTVSAAIAVLGLDIVGIPITAEIGTLTAQDAIIPDNAMVTGVGAQTAIGTLATPTQINLTGVAASANFSGPLESMTSHAGMQMTDLRVVTLPTQIHTMDITLRWSDTDGNAWSNGVRRTLGLEGEYLTSVQWRRLGMSRRGRVFELSWSVPFPVMLQSATLTFVDAGT